MIEEIPSPTHFSPDFKLDHQLLSSLQLQAQQNESWSLTASSKGSRIPGF